MEASSIGIAEHRLAGTRIAVALFTNFTQDHLDYHGDMDAYWQAKAQLFAWPGLRAAVVNIDDAQGRRARRARCAATPIDTWTVSTRGDARLRRARTSATAATAWPSTCTKASAAWRSRTPLIGDYNVTNLLAVVGALRALGVGAGRRGRRLRRR